MQMIVVDHYLPPVGMTGMLCLHIGQLRDGFMGARIFRNLQGLRRPGRLFRRPAAALSQAERAEGDGNEEKRREFHDRVRIVSRRGGAGEGCIPTGREIPVDACRDHRIRKVSLSRINTAVAGYGTPGFSGDGRPATTADSTDPLAWRWTARATLT